MVETREPWHRSQQNAGRRCALHRQDRMHVDARLNTAAVDATAQHGHRLTQCPGDAARGVVTRCVFARDPSLGYTADVQLEHAHGDSLHG